MVEVVTLLSVCVNPFGPVQLKVYGPFPPVALAVKEAEFPEQTVKDCGLIEQLGSVSTLIVIGIKPWTRSKMSPPTKCATVPSGPYSATKVILPSTMSARCALTSKSVDSSDLKKFVPPAAHPPGAISASGAMIGTPDAGVSCLKKLPL